MYFEIEKATKSYDTKVKCGILPTTQRDGNALIIDFCAKAKLKIEKQLLHRTKLISNSSFHPYLVEAVSKAYCLGNFNGLPLPHDNNNLLEKISKLLPSTAKQDSKLATKLLTYIDQYYWPSNLLLCQRHGLSESFFKPNDSPTKAEIEKVIIEENSFRTKHFSDEISRQQELYSSIIAANLSLIDQANG